MRWVGSCHGIVLALGILAVGAASEALAQIPNEPAEINACVCLQLGSAALAAEKDAKTGAFADVDRHLADLNAQLDAEKPRVDVNNPDAVSRFKLLLGRRDAASGQIDPARAAAVQAVDRYNANVGEYNRRCAGRPFNSELVAQIQARPNCAPPPPPPLPPR
jgi:hypothetical protein